MNEYKYILIDIDTQNDFLNPKGTLYLPGSEQIIPNLKKLFTWAKEKNIPVISTVDSHIPDDPEFKEFPPHCVVGTWGHRKIPAALLDDFHVSKIGEKLDENILDRYQQVIFQKQTYNIFSNFFNGGAGIQSLFLRPEGSHLDRPVKSRLVWDTVCRTMTIFKDSVTVQVFLLFCHCEE